MSDIPQRAGVIPFYRNGKDTYFFLGVDSKYKELTDFGGRISPRTDKTPIHGGFREFQEESYGAFGRIKPFSKHKKYAIFYDKMIIIYVELISHIDVPNIKSRFMKSLKNAPYKELMDIVHIEKNELLEMVNDENCHKIYSKVKNHLKFSEDFISNL